MIPSASSARDVPSARPERRTLSQSRLPCDVRTRAVEAEPRANATRVDQLTWTHEECVDYEVAREIITSLMGFRSLWMGREEAKPAPDLAQIEAWKRELAALALELRGLLVTDVATIARIHDVYGPKARRLVVAERARTP
jgi:hypothetical protein